MLSLDRIAVCLILFPVSYVPFADGQSTGYSRSHNPVSNVFFSRCDQTESAATFHFFSKSPSRPPGLNVDSTCLAEGQIQLLEIDLQSFEQEVRYLNWPPMFCGFAHDVKGEPFWVCVKG